MTIQDTDPHDFRLEMPMDHFLTVRRIEGVDLWQLVYWQPCGTMGTQFGLFLTYAEAENEALIVQATFERASKVFARLIDGWLGNAPDEFGKKIEALS